MCHAPARIQSVKLAGASSGSLLSRARKSLKLNFVGSSFITASAPSRPFRLSRQQTSRAKSLQKPVLHSVQAEPATLSSKSQILYSSLDSLRSSRPHRRATKFRVGAVILPVFPFRTRLLVSLSPAAVGANFSEEPYFRVVRKT